MSNVPKMSFNIVVLNIPHEKLKLKLMYCQKRKGSFLFKQTKKEIKSFFLKRGSTFLELFTNEISLIPNVHRLGTN